MPASPLPLGPILIVEDEAIVAADIEQQLHRAGYASMGPVASAAEALCLVRERRPQAALLDIRLQGDVDGIALAERLITELEIPIIYLTAHADPATLERAKVTESFGYLLKPFDERLLEITIGMAIYKHRAELERKRLIHDLGAALENVRVLSGLLTTCCDCKKIADDAGKWVPIETYITQRSAATFSHTYCPDCVRKHFPDIAATVFTRVGKNGP